MKVKRNFTFGILIIMAVIMTTNEVATKRGDRPSRFRRAKNSITDVLTRNPKSFLNWRTSSFAIHFYKAIGMAPVVKESNVDRLLELIKNEADLIKIGSFGRLLRLSIKPNLTEEDKKKLILAKLQVTIELVKFYGVVWNSRLVKWTFGQGMYFAHCCKKLFGEDKQGECLRKEIQLFAAFMFSYKIEINRFVRLFINRLQREANKYLPGDKTIKFIDTKIACEVKFAQDQKNFLYRTALKMYIGTYKKDVNCVTDLLPFENDLKEIDSYPSEFYYLIARGYSHQNNYKLALEYLRIARMEHVLDSKTRETNKKVQDYYEKIYTRMNAM